MHQNLLILVLAVVMEWNRPTKILRQNPNVGVDGKGEGKVFQSLRVPRQTGRIFLPKQGVTHEVFFLEHFEFCSVSVRHDRIRRSAQEGDGTKWS